MYLSLLSLDRTCPDDCTNSSQGICDTSTGICDCKPGIAGHNCAGNCIILIKRIGAEKMKQLFSI